MSVLDTFAQFYAWSWIATIGALLLALVVLFARTAQNRAASRYESRFQESLFARMLKSIGIDPKDYARTMLQPALAQQLSTCEGCGRRTQCAQELALGRHNLTACPNAEPVTRYLASRGMPA